MYLQKDAWEQTLKAALCPHAHADYGSAMSAARNLMISSGTAAFDTRDIYNVVDWLHDLYGAIIETYHRLDGRPYYELVFNRIVLREALYVKIYPVDRREQ